MIFVHHKNAEDSILQLTKIFPSIAAETAATRV
jgi:hypothetical protein